MKRIHRKTRRIIEVCIVVAVAGAAFGVARHIAVAERVPALIGGEVCVPLLIVGGWYAVKSIIKDIKGGLFHE